MSAQRRSEQGGARLVLLVVCCFFLGVGATVLWFNRAALAGRERQVSLTETTRTVLGNLTQPVELRFYSVLDVTNLPASIPALSSHVGRLLAAYQEAGNGKIKVSRFDSDPEAAAKAAAADGIKGFNREKGDVCYLGIAVEQNGRKELLAQLSPEWENAVEIDLTRAIEKVAQPVAGAVSAVPVPVEPRVQEELKRTVPNLDSLSLDEGTKLIRVAGLKEFEATARDYQARIETAEQQVRQSQTNATAAELQAAVEQLRRLEAERSDKLMQIGARSQAQIQALQQLKGSPQR